MRIFFAVVPAKTLGAVRLITNVEQIRVNAVIRVRQPVALAISPMHLGRKHGRVIFQVVLLVVEKHIGASAKNQTLVQYRKRIHMNVAYVPTIWCIIPKPDSANSVSTE